MDVTVCVIQYYTDQWLCVFTRVRGHLLPADTSHKTYEPTKRKDFILSYKKSYWGEIELLIMINIPINPDHAAVRADATNNQQLFVTRKRRRQFIALIKDDITHDINTLEPVSYQ